MADLLGIVLEGLGISLGLVGVGTTEAENSGKTIQDATIGSATNVPITGAFNFNENVPVAAATRGDKHENQYQAGCRDESARPLLDPGCPGVQPDDSGGDAARRVLPA